MSRLHQFPVSLPKVPVPENTQPTEVAEQFRNIFERLNEDSFVEDAAWRDSYALTGTLRSFYGTASVFQAWTECCSLASPQNFQLLPVAAEQVNLPDGSSWIEIGFSFETANEPQLLCTAFLSICKHPVGEGWKVWVMRTVADELKEVPYLDSGPCEPDVQRELAPAQASVFDCVIIGAGAAGLNTAARCAALGISYVILEKNARVGDNWRLRYESAKLHTIREYSHLPYDRTFDDNYPEFLTKDDLAKGYIGWVEKFHINIRLDTKLLSGKWDDNQRKWTLNFQTGESLGVLTTSYVVLAVGVGGQVPYLPQLPGREKYQGVVLHSEEYHSPKGFGGRRGVVVGSANTAHDVAEDMLEAGLSSITMVQRSKTYVLPIEWYINIQSRKYNSQIPTTLADKLGNSLPNPILSLISRATLHTFARQNPERFIALEKAGFRVEVFGDPVYQILERLGGHYMDVGASQKIAAGEIKMKSNSALTHYTENGLGFADGTELPADLVVFATGFDADLRNRVRELFGEEIAQQVGDFSRVNDEGELEGANPGLACHGGAIGPSRYFSRFLALHMKAELMGTPLKGYQKLRMTGLDSKITNGHAI